MQDHPVKPPVKRGPLFVPKRSGLGWTLNFERWEAYVIIGLILAVVIYKLAQPDPAPNATQP